MTMDHPAPAATTGHTPSPDSADRAPFARLADELAELGFDADTYATAGPRSFAAPDSTLGVVIDDSTRPPRAVLTSGEGEPAWEITLRGEVPDPTALLVLYAALHPHDLTAATQAATAVLIG
jgi:hypothetical protein